MPRASRVAPNFLRLLALLTMLTACSGAPSPNQAPSGTATPSAASQPAPELAARVDAYLAALVKDDLFSGSILVARRGTVLLSKGYGQADLEHEVPNAPHTKFRLGSITKQFTAMAILILQERGKLSVQDPICTYVPECPAAWQPVTIHHLLTHTSGISNYTEFPDYQSTKVLPSLPSKTVARFKDKPLEFTPGDRFSYSNSGYLLLGVIIENVSGHSYAVFLREQIFEPLQMRDTGYDHTSSVIRHRASGYVDRYRKAEYIDMSIPHADGALYSTVEDLYRWDQALYTEQLVPKAALDQMSTPFASMPADDGSAAGYGYGWVVTAAFNRRALIHGGGIEGFRTHIARFPGDQVTIIVLSNFERAPVDDISYHVAKQVFEAEAPTAGGVDVSGRSPKW